MKSYDWQNIRARLAEALEFIPKFARHPVRGMRTLPDWEWPVILILQACFAAATGSLGKLVERSWLGIITAVVVAPVTYAVVTAALTGLFFYAFRFVFKRDVPFRQIYLAVVFASLPGQLLIILAPLAPALTVPGVFAWCALIYVTFTDVFHLPRTPIRNLLAVMFIVYAGVTVRQILNSKAHRVQLKERASPESLDILEKELNPGGSAD